ncbi:MAG TPA: nucleotidyltransferase family protein [Acidobacteriaceae bacterium]|nr:nucleotidyltransferase family protein [Acidobacteriaceae bacterium]
MLLEMSAAIVLAAGASQRLGRPKQLVAIDSETLLQRALRIAHDAGCAPVVAVLGAHHETILAHSDLHQAVTVINRAWQEGIASSIRLGLKALPRTAKGAVLLTCDQPAISAAHLRLLMASSNITASAYAGRRGVPAYFPASSFSELMKLRGDRGARSLLHTAAAIHLPGGELDIDTAADLAQAKLLFR